MKKLSIDLILPLAIISMAILTKRWYVLPIDAPETWMLGFPFAYVSDAWHTSMSVQIFLLELIFDIMFYFLFWLLFIFSINHFLFPVKISKLLKFTLFSFSGIFIIIALFLVNFPEHKFHLYRT